MCVKSARWGCGKRNRFVRLVAEILDMGRGINIAGGN